MKRIDPVPIDLYTTEELLTEIRKRTSGHVFVGVWKEGRLSTSGAIGLSIRSVLPYDVKNRRRLAAALRDIIDELGDTEDGKRDPRPQRPTPPRPGYRPKPPNAID